jgi:hypothetical protein
VSTFLLHITVITHQNDTHTHTHTCSSTTVENSPELCALARNTAARMRSALTGSSTLSAISSASAASCSASVASAVADAIVIVLCLKRVLLEATDVDTGVETVRDIDVVVAAAVVVVIACVESELVDAVVLGVDTLDVMPRGDDTLELSSSSASLSAAADSARLGDAESCLFFFRRRRADDDDDDDVNERDSGTAVDVSDRTEDVGDAGRASMDDALAAVVGVFGAALDDNPSDCLARAITTPLDADTDAPRECAVGDASRGESRGDEGAERTCAQGTHTHMCSVRKCAHSVTLGTHRFQATRHRLLLLLLQLLLTQRGDKLSYLARHRRDGYRCCVA